MNTAQYTRSTVREIAKRAADRINSQFVAGDVVSEADFDRALEWTWPDIRSPAAFKKATLQRMRLFVTTRRILLREHKILIDAEGSGGNYLVVKNEERVSTSFDKFARKFYSAASLAQDELTHVKLDEFSASQNRERVEALAKISAIKSTASTLIPETEVDDSDSDE